MKQATIFDCDQRHEPILAHEGFVRFKDPDGKLISSSTIEFARESAGKGASRNASEAAVGRRAS